MTPLPHLQIGSADWRAQLRRNETRTRWVIFLFLFTYLGLGFFIDVLWVSHKVYYLHGQPVFLPVNIAAKALLTGQLFPYATLSAGIVAIVSLLITYKAHDKIMLLGTEYTEVTAESLSIEEKQLYNVVEEMKVAAGLHYMPRVYIINAPYMNAFASGYSEKSAMVAITRGLMDKLNRAELQAVMAHELSHIRHHDIKLTLFASVLSNLMLIIMDILFYSIIFGREERRENNGIIVVVMLLRYLLPLITVLLMLYLSRSREYMADAGCVELTRQNEPLAQALLKIHADHSAHTEQYRHAYGTTAHEDVRRAAYIYDPSQAGLRPSASLTSAFSSHPSLEDRLRALGINITTE
ncbi:MAG: zinc metalloprotease HtpX [Gammaproteobacteria bacterium]